MDQPKEKKNDYFIQNYLPLILILNQPKEKKNNYLIQNKKEIPSARPDNAIIVGMEDNFNILTKVRNFYYFI